MKSPLCIVLCLCSAFMACNRENPETGGGRDRPAKEEPAAEYLRRFEHKHDPVDLLRALETARGFNRALALERLYLTKEAIASWNEVVQEDPGRSEEAKQHLQRLQKLPDPVRQWDVAALHEAVRHRDRDALTRIARAFPADAAREFERLDLRDRDGGRLLANALAAAGQRYPQAVVDAMDRTKDRVALEQGLAALHHRKYQSAVTLLERAGNPLSLAARYYVAATPGEPAMSIIDAIIPHLEPRYDELASRIHVFRAYLLEQDGRLLAAHADYEKALAYANRDPTVIVTALSRRDQNYAFIGATEKAFGDAHHIVSLLDRVADTDARHQAYATAAIAAMQLGHPLAALYYQNAAVEDVQRALLKAPAGTVVEVKNELSVALRKRAEIYAALGRHANAKRDLEVAADLAEAVNNIADRALLHMRIRDVQGQLLLKSQPAQAASLFGEAIDLAKDQDSTYRAILHFQRAAARRGTGDPRADDDLAIALQILRAEVQRALVDNPYVASVPLWTPYFSRFRDRYDELIESRITAGDTEGAFVLAELARAFEPMQILLQSGSVPPGYRPIESLADLAQARANLPQDTVILQFLVMPEHTYTWVVTRERILVVPQRSTRKKIEGWVADALAAIAAGQRDPFDRVRHAAYGELFRAPLASVARSKTRIVIVPDEPMQGLPFHALQGLRDEGYLIERGNVAVAGSTSLYLYALARDRQLSSDHGPSALLIGDPAFDPSPLAPPLLFARQEVNELASDYYRDAAMLTGADATVAGFMSGAKTATIIHFAGHALANSQDPWQSRLLFAPGPQGESGELTAQALMQQLPRLERTRLVVLGACSTAGGGSVGPQGLAPLVRPLIAAHVPAVVGTLWDVKDASAKDLLVSFHCHYRHGDDVAVALRNAQLESLRKAQLERLRNNDNAMRWAAFQVVGYAASPYARSIALEDPNSEHLCTQDSLQRPDGLHSQ
jgi:CHAT domain-containing protein